MSWPEFCSLLSGLMHDTPLGVVVQIRSEKDQKVISKFSRDQKRIRDEWLRRRWNDRKNYGGQYADIWEAFRIAAKEAYGKK